MSQETARTLRDAGLNGIVDESVRNPGGETPAASGPRLSNCRQERHLCYVWDGSGIRYRLREAVTGKLNRWQLNAVAADTLSGHPDEAIAKSFAK